MNQLETRLPQDYYNPGGKTVSQKRVDPKDAR